MKHQIPVDPSARIDCSVHHGLHAIAGDLAYHRLAIVNVAFVGPEAAGDRGWVLVDAGLTGTAPLIRVAARERFGDGARPRAIVLTHAHFDHVGALKTLAEGWDVPVYVHADEKPFLDGREAYPPPNPAAGGLMSALSVLFPRGPTDLGERLRTLPSDGAIPGMPGWRWIHTPGHTPGHVSLWREEDRALIAGDAFITTRQESVYSAATQQPEMHGPPMYFTPDWVAAGRSVRRLADLEPETAITGHGRAIGGPDLRRSLRELADNFERVAVPATASGR